MPTTDLPVRCSCGETTVRERLGRGYQDAADKCPTCGTFADDHDWDGTWSDPSDNASPRCMTCDTRYGSHRKPLTTAERERYAKAATA